jgi:glycosyltransferase involved in cell wall biosynthesis
MKDHALFLRAMARVSKLRKNVAAVLVGKGTDSAEAKALPDYSSAHVVPLGDRSNVADLMTAFDAFVLSSSHGEGFPNAVGEALSVALPCIVTDVGDCKYIVGDNGIVVPAMNEEKMVSALLLLVDLSTEERLRIGLAGRKRAESIFAIDSISAQYVSVWKEAARYVS